MHKSPEVAAGSELAAQSSPDILLARYSPEVLAKMAGLKAPAPIVRLLRSPRYGARLSRYLMREASRMPASIPQHGVAPDEPETPLAPLFEALGLSWGLKRAKDALTPQDMQALRAMYTPEVLVLVHEFLADLQISPAYTVPAGVGWLMPDRCRLFGQAVFLGWLDQLPGEIREKMAVLLGTDAGDMESRRVEALDGMIEAFLRSREQG